MKKLFYLRILIMILIVMWCNVIFGFSAKNGTQSSKSSGRVTKAVISVCYPACNYLNTGQQEKVFHKVNFIIRKTAHFLEYAILALLITILIITFDKKGISAIISAVVICAVLAAADEMHQGFVPGRNPAVKDVVIDSFGALAGSGTIILIYNICIKHKNGGSYDI